MSQRNSEYKRQRRDAYHTPTWVTEALLPHIPRRIRFILEPAAGDGAIADVLRKAGRKVKTYDIKTGHDFLAYDRCLIKSGIITNPPYKHAQEFIERALALTNGDGFVAMLLRIDFDSGKTRRHLFAENPVFAKKIVLLNRIRWIKNSKGSPSENHAWYLFDWKHKGPPIINYTKPLVEPNK